MTIWKRTYLRKLPCLDLANWSIYMETRESCCLKCSFSLTLCEIPWRSSSILPNAKISRTLCKVPWQFPDLEKFYFSLTFPRWLLTLMRNRLKLHRTTCIIFTTQYMNYYLSTLGCHWNHTGWCWHPVVFQRRSSANLHNWITLEDHWSHKYIWAPLDPHWLMLAPSGVPVAIQC